jgi:hypothetical protein
MLSQEKCIQWQLGLFSNSSMQIGMKLCLHTIINNGAYMTKLKYNNLAHGVSMMHNQYYSVLLYNNSMKRKRWTEFFLNVRRLLWLLRSFDKAIHQALPQQSAAFQCECLSNKPPYNRFIKLTHTDTNSSLFLLL